MEIVDHSEKASFHFNSELEVGIRTIVILNAFYPQSMDIRQISIFDYFIVHSEDIGGPKSIHPKISSRSGEFFVRRRLIQNGLKFLHRTGLVEKDYNDNGICFRSKEIAGAMLDLTQTSYNLALQDRANWLKKKSETLSIEQFEEKLQGLVGHWNIEFEGTVMADWNSNEQ